MLARSILIVFGIVSAVWVTYSGFSLLERDNKFQAHIIFNSTDSIVEMLKIDENQFVFSKQFPTTSSNEELIEGLSFQTGDRVYISAKRDHILIHSKEIYTEKKVREMTAEDGVFEVTSDNNFTFSGYKGTIYSSFCYLTKSKFETEENNIQKEFHFDKNADAVEIEFQGETPSITDIYLLEEGKFEYKIELKKDYFAAKVNEKDVFAVAIPKRVSSYEFYERDYLQHKDSIFATGPMVKWVKTGAVYVKVNGKPALITDYILGQNPISILDEANGTFSDDENRSFYDDISLSKNLNNIEGFHIYIINDYAVISTSKETCELIASDIKLGNTIAHSPAMLEHIYSGLPQKVNHRIVDATTKQASSIYKSQLLTTTVNQLERNENGIESTPTSYALDAGEPLKDFYFINEDEVFTITATNKVVFFRNKKKVWEKSIKEALVGQPQLIDIYANGKQQLLLTTKNKVHLIDRLGRPVTGFPTQLENNPVFAATFYRWKGISYFLIPTEKNSIIQLDGKGRELDVIETDLNKIAQSLIVWKSANQPFVAVCSANNFEMHQLERMQLHRKFTFSNSNVIAKIPNEIYLFGIEEDALIAYNQKGEKSTFEEYPNGEILSCFQNGLNPTILLKTQNKLSLINHNGITWSEVRIPFNEFSEVQLHELNNKEIIISIIDDLQNNVYLFDTKGKQLKKKHWEGSNKANLFSSSKNLQLQTIVDNLLVVYNE